MDDDEYLNDKEEGYSTYHLPYEQNPYEHLEALHNEQVQYQDRQQQDNTDRYAE